jgi:small subunit ribosomal protein S16
MGGVKKGAFDLAEAERKLDAWMTEKDAKVQAKIDRLAADADKEFKKQFAAEVKVKEQKAAAIAAKNAELAAEAQAAKEAETEEAPAAEAPAEGAES